MVTSTIFERNEKTLVTLLSLLAVSTVSAFTKLEDLTSSLCETRYPEKMMDCWNYEDENVAIFATVGDKDVMEDKILFEKNIDGKKLSIYGVFDGIGKGKAVDYVVNNLMGALKEELKNAEGLDWDESKIEYFTIDYRTILKKTLAKIEENVLKEMEDSEDYSGTTATIALIDEGKKRLYIANIGNSRAIMGDKNGETHRLSIDHKPGTPSERKRIEDAGGEVVFSTRDWRVEHVNVSRLLGFKAKKNITANPDTFVFDLSKHNPKLLVLTSTGILYGMLDDAVVALAEDRLAKPEEYFGAEVIGKMGYARGANNNIAILVVKMLQSH